MSIPKNVTVKCQKCGVENHITVFESINTDYAPNIAQQIIDGDLFSAKCPKCGHTRHLEYDVLYHDIKHGAMIWVLHKNKEDYASKVEEIQHSNNVLSYKITRIVNNMNGLREKIACLEQGRDDRIIELCKVYSVIYLSSKDPEFNCEYAFYNTIGGKEYIFFYDKNGEEKSCELPENAYEFVSELYYNSKYYSEFKDNYAIVDYEWALSVFTPLMKKEYEQSGKKENTETTTPPPHKEQTNNNRVVVCPKCKQSLPDDSCFCQYCGTPIQFKNNTSYESTAKEKTSRILPTASTTVPNKTIPQRTSRAHKKSLAVFLILGITAVLIAVGVLLGIPEYRYHQACSALEDGLYFKAIELFEELDGYKNSENKILEIKYKYVLENKNNNNVTTYEYLTELKYLNYKNSTDLYDNLYEWKIEVVAINTNKNDESTRKSSISKSSPIYFHILLTGGKPNTSMRVTVKSKYPNGDTDEYTFDDKMADGEIGWYGWYEGLYEYPEYGATGTLQCKFYDENGNLIGSGSVIITD